MRSFSLALAILAVSLCFATGNRVLQQAPANANNRTMVPTPAPAPNDCPAKKNPGTSCVTEATAFQTSCASFIRALNTATGGQVTATSDDQITALVGSLQANGSTPTSGCCTAARGLLSDACACDTTVQTLARSQQNLSPSEFQTVGKVFLNACGYPACFDTCELTS